MILSRTKVADDSKKNATVSVREKNKSKPIELEQFIAQQDYTGAITLLEIYRESGQEVQDLDLWLAYAAFHIGDYQRASVEYEDILKTNVHQNGQIYIYLACCYFMLGRYEEAERAALKGSKCPLQTRVLFHIAYKQNDQEKSNTFQRQLQDTVEDQLSLASMHFMKSNYQQALDIYKRYLSEHRNYIALHVYVAICYYKLDYYDISQELLETYLKKHSESPTAVNVQACNQYRLNNGRSAENEYQTFLRNTSTSFNYAEDLFRHNMVVFRNGKDAIPILTPLIGILPEAGLNLVIYYLQEDDVDNAFDLMKDIEAAHPTESILKGVVNVAYGQKHNSYEHIKTAQSYFQAIGSSANECDTVSGRQSMAAYYFLQKRFYDVLVYLTSIKTYFHNDDTFNFNYAQAKAREDKWLEAEEAFLRIQNEKITNDSVYLTWLTRCFICNKKPHLAWDLYVKLGHSRESFLVLQLIAHDCYKHGCFFYAARAFDVLERRSPDPEYWHGKVGACVGTFRQVIAGRESRERLRDILTLLRNMKHPLAEQATKIIRAWANQNNTTL